MIAQQTHALLETKDFKLLQRLWLNLLADSLTVLANKSTKQCHFVLPSTEYAVIVFKVTTKQAGGLKYYIPDVTFDKKFWEQLDISDYDKWYALDIEIVPPCRIREAVRSL